MSNNINKKIEIDVNEAVKLLAKLVEIPSIKGKKNDKIINIIEKELKNIGCLTQIDIANSEDVADNPIFSPLPEGVEKSKNI